MGGKGSGVPARSKLTPLRRTQDVKKHDSSYLPQPLRQNAAVRTPLLAAENKACHVPFRYFSQVAGRTIFTPDMIKKKSISEMETIFDNQMKGTLTGYTKTEAEVFLKVFERDIQGMLYLKILEEIIKYRITDVELIKDYRRKHENIKRELDIENSSILMDGFRKSELWFATFSDREVSGIIVRSGAAEGREYAGSIYFDGGRMRLIHKHGPHISKIHYVRAIGKTVLTKADNDERFRHLAEEYEKSLKDKKNENETKDEKANLREYLSSKDAEEMKHCKHHSRGLPKKVEDTTRLSTTQS